MDAGDRMRNFLWMYAFKAEWRTAARRAIRDKTKETFVEDAVAPGNVCIYLVHRLNITCDGNERLRDRRRTEI